MFYPSLLLSALTHILAVCGAAVAGFSFLYHIFTEKHSPPLREETAGLE